MHRESRTLRGFFDVENDGRSHVDRPKLSEGNHSTLEKIEPILQQDKRVSGECGAQRAR
jgi:hypothetical protein